MEEENKPFVPHSHFPYDKAGSGLFSHHNLNCHEAIREDIPMALQGVEAIKLKNGAPFTIVDYGTADGGTSMPLIYACVKAVREKYGDEVPINVIYEDQPVNDFSSVFLRTQGFFPGPRSFLLDFPNVFVMASGTNFYSQCFPSNSVTLGFSSLCVHWLRDKPCNLTGTIHHLFITIPEEKEKFRAQAEKDWERFLIKRSVELMPGGRMTFAQFVVDEHGQFAGGTDGIKVKNEAFLSQLWKEISDEGIITKEEFTRTNFWYYFRTVDEFQKPFKSADSPVVKAGLELVSMETRILPCPYREKWLKNQGNIEDNVKNYVESIRLWSNTSFMSGLSESRSDEEKRTIVDDLFRRFENEVAKRVEDFGLDFVIAYFTVQKRI